MSSKYDNECKYCDEQLKQLYKLDCGHEICLTCAQEMCVMAMLQKKDLTCDELAAQAKQQQQQASKQQNYSNGNNNEIIVEERHLYIAIHCPEWTVIERHVNLFSNTCNVITAVTANDNSTNAKPKTVCDNCDGETVSNAIHNQVIASTSTANVTAPMKHCCGKHPDKILEFYCTKCNEMKCVASSLVGDHKRHDHISLQNYMETIGTKVHKTNTSPNATTTERTTTRLTR